MESGQDSIVIRGQAERKDERYTLMATQYSRDF
jgi:hypothetical protein